jgi:hypothetical protein
MLNPNVSSANAIIAPASSCSCGFAIGLLVGLARRNPATKYIEFRASSLPLLDAVTQDPARSR